MKKKEQIRYALDRQEVVNAHFGRLTKLLQDEQKADRQRFQSEFLQKRPEVREKAGKALLRLVLREVHYNPSGQRLLSFGYSDRRFLPRYSLAAGDVVVLSGFQTPPNDRPTGIVYEKDRSKILVAFNDKLPGWVGRDAFYALNVSENLTTYDRMFEALRDVGRARHSRTARLRDISLGLKNPEFKDPVKPEKIDFFNHRLNEKQKKAVCMALEAEDVMLIHGPPGTGKTIVLVEIIRQARRRQETVLVSAPSNAACDHVVDCLVKQNVPVTRLGHPARMTERLREHLFSYKLAAHPLCKRIEENEARLEQLMKRRERRQDRRVMEWEDRKAMREEMEAIRKDIRDLKAEIFRQTWHSSEVVVATHAVCGDPILKARTFDWGVVDEATQGIEPSTWISLSHAGKIVLAGDHCQLPPTVFSPKQGPESLRCTLFERFHQRLGDASKIRLEAQYRMNENIMNFSSKEFYECRLTAPPEVRGRVLSDLEGVSPSAASERPVVFLDTAGLGYEETEDMGSGSRYNGEEARLVKKEYERLIEFGVPPAEIAVISPYSAQVKLLVSLIYEKDQDLEPGERGTTEIDSIDAFQGREKEAVIVSLVRSNLKGEIGFLADTRRMNVAMTRARRKLIVIGDSATIATLPFYKDFLDYVESIDGYLSAWEYEM